MKIRTALALAAFAAMTAGSAGADVIYVENFDGAGTLGFTTEDTAGNAVAQFVDVDEDYFAQTDGRDIPGLFFGVTGNFFAAQDLDGNGGPSMLRLRIVGIDVSNYENLALSVDFSEDDDGGNEDWDAGDFVHVNLSLDTVDGGADDDPSLYGIWVENDGGGTNEAPLIDSDFDGTDDGAEITDTFATYSSQAFAQTGNTAGILITIALSSGDEDIAIDNITLTGDPVPEPGSLALLGLGGLLIARRRR